MEQRSLEIGQEEQLSAKILSLLIGGCGLSHKHVEGGCKGTCVKFVG